MKDIEVLKDIESKYYFGSAFFFSLLPICEELNAPLIIKNTLEKLIEEDADLFTFSLKDKLTLSDKDIIINSLNDYLLIANYLKNKKKNDSLLSLPLLFIHNLLSLQIPLFRKEEMKDQSLLLNKIIQIENEIKYLLDEVSDEL